MLPDRTRVRLNPTWEAERKGEDVRGSSRDPQATPFSRNRNVISNLLDTYHVLDLIYSTNSPRTHPAHTSQPSCLNA